MGFLACPHCLSLSIYPWMGFTTGQRYLCQSCEEVSVLVLEFDTEADYLETLEAARGGGDDPAAFKGEPKVGRDGDDHDA
jgi:hypothetical protein